jgi:hypothetical protein
MGMVEVIWAETPDPFANTNNDSALAAAEGRLRTIER